MQPTRIPEWHILIAFWVCPCYTRGVMEDRVIETTKSKPRKKRSDRTHIVYCLRVKNLQYIGITAKTASTANKSVWSRARKHFHRSNDLSYQWPLYQAIRKHGFENFTHEVLAVVRGKAEAHKIELEMIKTQKPKLNAVGL
jgi:hypothetical protein